MYGGLIMHSEPRMESLPKSGGVREPNYALTTKFQRDDMLFPTIGYKEKAIKCVERYVLFTAL